MTFRTDLYFFVTKDYDICSWLFRLRGRLQIDSVCGILTEFLTCPQSTYVSVSFSVAKAYDRRFTHVLPDNEQLMTAHIGLQK